MVAEDRRRLEASVLRRLGGLELGRDRGLRRRRLGDLLGGPAVPRPLQGHPDGDVLSNGASIFSDFPDFFFERLNFESSNDI